MEQTALEKLDAAMQALEAEGYEFTQKTLYRTSTVGIPEGRSKQVIEVRCFKRLPAEEQPPEFEGLKSFLKGLTC
jgi:hypothetical protein